MIKFSQNQKEAFLITINVLVFILLLAVALMSIGSLGKSLIRAFETSSGDDGAGISFDFAGFRALNLQIK
jgi:hypothetical protein